MNDPPSTSPPNPVAGPAPAPLPAPLPATPVDAGGCFVETHCLDCGAALLGPHCHVCGQAARGPRTAMAVWRGIVRRGARDRGGRAGRTLAALIRHPGDLTRRYIAGERTRFLSPLALFALCFVLLAATARIVGPGSDLAGAAATDRSLARAERALRVAARIDGDAGIERDASHADAAELALRERADSALFFVEQARIAWNRDAMPDDLAARAGRDAGEKARPRWAAAAAAILAWAGADGSALVWLPIAPLTLVMWFSFVISRRSSSVYDHTVFVMYSLGFASLLAAIGMVAVAIGLPVVWAAGIVALGWALHLAVQLRGAYRLGWWGTGWRVVVVVVAPALLALIAAPMAAG